MQQNKRSRIAGLTALLVASIAAGSLASAEDLKVKLTGAQESPAVATSATGTGTITVRDDKSVSGSVKTTGIKGTMAHVHLGSKGKNGPPIISLVQSGDAWSVPAGSKLSDDQYKSFKAGDLYINVHSDAHPDGEIRAQLTP
jgi:hypothetical protein